MGERLPSARQPSVCCPKCGASVDGAKTASIDWNAERREFSVRLAFYCPPCGYSFASAVVKRLPVTIARESRCSCGSRLELSDHSFSLTEDGDVTFDGKYICPRCKKEKNSVVQWIRKGLMEIWDKTIRIKLGPTGIEYEKGHSQTES